MSDDDDLPPLEDKSELVASIIDRNKAKETKTPSRELLDLEPDKYVPDLIKADLPQKPQKQENTEKPQKVLKSKKPKNSGFGGFQAGFLSGGAKKKKPPKKEEEIEEIITPKARDQLKRDNPLVLQEVQEQMKNELADEEFLSSYENNEKLMRQMADPKFARAIEFMQRDPAACKEYYQKHDPKFFQENMKRIAGHMDKRASQQNAQGDTSHLTSQDERKMKDIMSRPDVQQALSDPDIAALLGELRLDPVKGQQRLNHLKPSSKKHIDTLIRNGLLQIQR